MSGWAIAAVGVVTLPSGTHWARLLRFMFKRLYKTKNWGVAFSIAKEKVYTCCLPWELRCTWTSEVAASSLVASVCCTHAFQTVTNLRKSRLSAWIRKFLYVYSVRRAKRDGTSVRTANRVLQFRGVSFRSFACLLSWACNVWQVGVGHQEDSITNEWNIKAADLDITSWAAVRPRTQAVPA